MATRLNFWFLFYSNAYSFRFMDYRITTHTNFSLNSRLIQLYSQTQTCNCSHSRNTSWSHRRDFRSCVCCLPLCTDSNSTKCRKTATYSKEDVKYSTCTHYFWSGGYGFNGRFLGRGTGDTSSSYYNNLSK